MEVIDSQHRAVIIETRRKGDLRSWIGHGAPSKEPGDAKVHFRVRIDAAPGNCEHVGK